MAVQAEAPPEAGDGGDVLWRPSPDARATTRMGRYLNWLAENRGLAFDSYEDLWDWSVDDLTGFWGSIWDFFDVHSSTPYECVLASPTMPGAVWFPGAQLNYAEHALRATGDRVVLVSVSQTRHTVELTADQLRDQVARARAGLLRLGVGRGDRVAAYLPNVAEAVVAYLATASLGAIWSSCAPEGGTRSVIDRFRQIDPVVLLTIDGYCNGSTAVDRRDDVAEIRAALPSLRSTVVLPYLSEDALRIPGAQPWTELVATEAQLAFEPVPFDHPLHILYSSGTTGLPKPIVHGHGGILLEQLKALGLHHDLGDRDRFFWYSSTGWMMWNHLVGGLSVGAAIVCFDGNPTHPDLTALWRLVAETRVTYFGAGAPYFTACRRDAVNPGRFFDLSRLREVGSTASPLPSQAFHWIHDAVGSHVHIASMSGGTDVCTAVVGGSPLVPVRAGEISCRYLGARVEAYNPAGRSVVGVPGELVITAPMPSMPVGFWGDDDGSRLREAYFDKYPGVWAHGDWVTISDAGGCVISGRSDATLNRGGVRVGTAEVYAVVESMAEVSDSLIVHVEGSSEGDPGELLLFVVPAAGIEVDDALRLRIDAELLRQLSPGHVPDRITAVTAIPRTASGKKLEVPVKRLLQGAAPTATASRDAVANPEALDAFAFLARTSPHYGSVPALAAGQPAPEIVDTMARIWARALGLDRVEPQDDFFALGGTSLRAIGLLASVEQQFGVRLPLSVFLDGHATVAGMAALVGTYTAEQGGDPIAVPIRTVGTGPMLFFVQPTEGAMLTLRHFARALGAEQRVMGLLPEQPVRRGRSVEAMAMTMVDTIRASQPHGPYYLAGFSLGGLLVYEVATQLRASGEEIAWLAVVDIITPELIRRMESVTDRLGRLRERGLLDAARRVPRATRREIRSALLRLRFGQRAPTYRQVVAGYICRGNDAPMELFVTAPRVDLYGSPSLGWEGLHLGPLRIHEVPGHHAILLMEPHVHVLAERLAESLREAPGFTSGGPAIHG